MGIDVGATHLFIPDTQVRKSTPESPCSTDHLDWIGQYIVDQLHDRPNVKIIQIGDWWDMPSLSKYDAGKRAAEGRRYGDDIEAGNAAFDRLNAPLEQFNERRKRNKERQWWPERHFFDGNHEHRVVRATEDDPKLFGALCLDDMNVAEHGWIRHPFLEPVFLDGVGYCLTPDHRVLTTDLEYRPLGDVCVGDQLVGFEETAREGLPRRYQTSTVLATTKSRAPLFAVTLASGKVFRATSDHRWLARAYGTSAWKWFHTHELRSVHEICKPFGTWDQEMSWDAGWLAGILDGEGWLTKPNSAQGGIQLGVAQNNGITLDRIFKTLSNMGVAYNDHPSSGTRECQMIRILGTSGEKLAFLGRVGAKRLIAKFQPEMLGRVQAVRDTSDRVVSVRSIPDGEIVQLATSTGTFIADGYAHHNCHYFYNGMTGQPYGGLIDTRLKTVGHSFSMGHQQTLLYGIRYVGGRSQHGLVCGACYTHVENFKGPQGNAHWRGVIVKHQVQDGSYDPMFVSLDYLCRKYEGVSLAKFTGNPSL